MKVVIELDISTDPYPAVGEIKAAVYQYVRELLDDDSLAFRIKEVKEKRSLSDCPHDKSPVRVGLGLWECVDCGGRVTRDGEEYIE